MKPSPYLERRTRVENSLFYFIPTIMILSVWATYMILSGRFFLMLQHWEFSLTMIFGSLVAGATSEGGGAVSFPVFTKLLNIPPQMARTFGLAIQTVGMGTASIVIFKYKIRVVPRAIVFASIGGIIGITFGTYFVAPNLESDYFKLAFTLLTLAFGFVLYLENRDKSLVRFADIQYHSAGSDVLLLAAGVLGGVFTSVVGTGIDFITFSVLVLYFNISEKVATPTSVVLMAINSAMGFFLQAGPLASFDGAVLDYWLVCVPMVIFGAPIGAIICEKVSRENIIRFLLALILIEFATTILLVRINAGAGLFAGVFLSILLTIFYLLFRARARKLIELEANQGGTGA